MAQVAMVSLVSGTSCMVGLLIFILFCLWVKFTKLFGGFNATIYGNKRNKLEDPTKKVEKYMTNEFTHGLDDVDDVAVNPVLLFKIEQEKKRKAGVKKQASGTGRSGGLARLKLNIVEKKVEGGGKVKSLLDVEKYLSGQQGVDMSESSAAKNTQATGKAKVNVLAAAKAQGAAQSSAALLADSRANARAAAKGRKDEDDDDDGGNTAYL